MEWRGILIAFAGMDILLILATILNGQYGWTCAFALFLTLKLPKILGR